MSILKKIGCKNCGAEVVFDPSTQLSNCNFCGSTFEIESATDEEIIKPDSILPFSISKEEYQKAVFEFLSEGDYTPDDILTSTIFESVNGSYLPMWLYSGKYSGNWSASSGYNRTEEYVGKGLDGKLTTKTRTVTDWRPSNGNCNGEYTVFGFAGDSESVKGTIADYAHETQFSRGDLKNFDTEYTAGFTMLEFAQDQHETWDNFANSRAHAIIEASATSRIPGDTYKDFYVEAVFDKEKTLRTYVPFWITTYNYNDNEFYVYMDGRDMTRLKGTKPEDTQRKDEVAKKFYPGHIVLAVAIIMCFVLDMTATIGWVLVIAIIAAYVWGYSEKSKILNASKKIRQDILENYK